jgi:hypothetical protein
MVLGFPASLELPQMVLRLHDDFGVVADGLRASFSSPPSPSPPANSGGWQWGKIPGG